MNTIGPNIKRIREQHGWTQDQLAAKCNLIGWDISRGTLAKIEAKVRRITDIEIIQIASVLKVPISQLFD
ncbi:helix-turn-helix transcriptional regulator [Thiomicrorhabdus hydrogeniphila]